jgi:5-methylcytosine-specific restriction endonuclease McrA
MEKSGTHALKRKEFSASTKKLAFYRAAGHCEICTDEIAIGSCHFDHIIPAWMKDDNSLSNCACLCIPCHKTKTADRDVKNIAKVKRLIRGRRRSRNPLPFGRDSKLKRKLTGEIVER